MKKNRKNILKILSIAVIVLLSIFAVSMISLETIRDWVSESGIYAPFIYILLFSILPIFFFPVPILAFGGGVLFGLVDGTIYTVIGATINSTIMFYMTKFLGKEFLQDFLKKRVSSMVRGKLLTKNQGILSTFFFLFRLIPLVSYNLINYLSGLTEIKFSNYILTTIIGIIPGTIVFLNVGDKSLDIGSPEFLWSIVWLGMLIVASSLGLKWYLKREHYD